MKKLKIFIVLILIFAFAFVNNVEAHSVELDPDDVITLPSYISNLIGGNIYISSTITDYDLYYQFIKIDDNLFNQIKNVSDAGEKELEKLNEEISKLEEEFKVELENLENVINEKEEIYNNLKENNECSEKLQQAVDEYNIAVNNYNEKLDEYNQTIQEMKTDYNNKIEELNNNINELIPMYDENNWKITESGNVLVDTSEFSGEVHFVLWAKLVCSNGSIIYDDNVYTTTGTKVEIESISISESSITLNEGESHKLSVTILPDDASNKNVNWTSDNESIAKVDNGTVMAISEGTATIIATSNDGNHKVTCKVMVKKKSVNEEEQNEDDKNEEIKVETIKLDKTEISLTKGSNIKLTATVFPENAINKSIIWTSDNETVAKVDNGTVTAISEGTAIITAKSFDGSVKATCKVTIVADNSNEPKKDSTTAQTPIPHTGYNSIFFVLITITIAFIIILKIVLKKYKDII